MSVTLNVPAAAYAWLGFCAVEVPPSPKFQLQLVGLPVDKSVKFTVSGAAPVVGVPEKFAVTSGEQPPPPPTAPLMSTMPKPL